jgi:hypothetical protein
MVLLAAYSANVHQVPTALIVVHLPVLPVLPKRLVPPLLLRNKKLLMPLPPQSPNLLTMLSLLLLPEPPKVPLLPASKKSRLSWLLKTLLLLLLRILL